MRKMVELANMVKLTSSISENIRATFLTDWECLIDILHGMEKKCTYNFVVVVVVGLEKK